MLCWNGWGITSNPHTMKKTIVGAVVVVVGIAGALWFSQKGSTHTYQNIIQTQEVEKRVEVDALQKQVNDALTASSTAIEERAKNAYNAAKRQAEVEIELEVTAKYRAQLEAREKELQKESVAY